MKPPNISKHPPILNEPILYVDTSSDTLMLGLSRDGVLIGRYEQPCDSHRYHSALMTPAIHRLLEQNDLGPRDLAAVAINQGPGSFTGVRTGLITARTLGQFLPAPLYAFNTFELLAWHAASEHSSSGPDRENPHTIPVTIHLDARRGKSFHAILQYEADGPIVLHEPALVSLSAESAEIAPANGGLLMASESLKPFFPTEPLDEHPCDFPAERTHFFEKLPYTPDMMRRLIGRYGAFFRRSWQDVPPLYLQEPSITLQPPRL